LNVEGERAFAASRAIVWEVLNDPEAMAKTMPGVQSFHLHDANRWTAQVSVPLALGALKLKVDMEKTEERELEFAAMQLKGKGVGALVNMQTRFDLSDAAAGGTVMRWKAAIRVAGQSVSMGQRVLQPIVDQQVQHVLGALDEQVQARSGRPVDEG
jgi:carbon monoxide dehydrogenase subunit G